VEGDLVVEVTNTGEGRTLAVEGNGINVISDAERKGRPAQLFWPWVRRCGVVALAGKRGSTPTMVLSRAAFGVHGNKLPTAISWLLTVGWETALTILATLATATVFERLGWGGGTATKLVALLVVAALVVGAGVLGFAVIMRLQTIITVVTGVLTVVFVVLAAGQVDWATVSALPSVRSSR
jgi:nucleobase:cation symporter-1, NCS1 family